MFIEMFGFTLRGSFGIFFNKGYSAHYDQINFHSNQKTAMKFRLKIILKIIVDIPAHALFL